MDTANLEEIIGFGPIGDMGEVVYNGFIVFRGDILGGNYDMESYFNSALPADLPKSSLPRCTLPFDMAGEVGGLGGLVVGLVLFGGAADY